MYSILRLNIDEVYGFSLTKFGVIMFIDSFRKSNRERAIFLTPRFSAGGGWARHYLNSKTLSMYLCKTYI